MKEIDVINLSKKIKNGEDIFLLDVREPHEYDLANIGGVLIPLNEIPSSLDKLDRSTRIYCLCHHGVRSAIAQDFLTQKGYTSVVNIIGGIDAWSLEVDSSICRY